MINTRRESGFMLAGLICIVLLGAAIAAWFTHVVVCLQAGKWGFLIAGAIFAPIGVIHGIGVWFGLF